MTFCFLLKCCPCWAFTSGHWRAWRACPCEGAAETCSCADSNLQTNFDSFSWSSFQTSLSSSSCHGRTLFEYWKSEIMASCLELTFTRPLMIKVETTDFMSVMAMMPMMMIWFKRGGGIKAMEGCIRWANGETGVCVWTALLHMVWQFILRKLFK